MKGAKITPPRELTNTFSTYFLLSLATVPNANFTKYKLPMAKKVAAAPKASLGDNPEEALDQECYTTDGTNWTYYTPKAGEEVSAPNPDVPVGFWECPICQRRFGKVNQGHFCVPDKSPDDHLAGKPEAIILAFDALLRALGDLENLNFGAAVTTIVFTHRVAFLIVKPTSKALNINFYLTDPALHDDERLKPMNMINSKRLCWTVKLKSEDDLAPTLISYFRRAFVEAG
jgi:hypothetical protein